MVDWFSLNLDTAVPGSEPKHRERESAVERELLQVIAADKDFEGSLFRITEVLRRHVPQTRLLIVLVDSAMGVSVSGNCAILNRALSEFFEKSGANKSGTGTRNWIVPLTSSSDIDNDLRWAGPWREIFKAHGILACQSATIRDREDTLAGCAMLCFTQPRAAVPFEKRLASFIARVIAILVSREQSARELRTRIEQIERLAVVGRLSASISHEINNPLEIVENLLFLLSSEVLSPTARSYLSSAQLEVQRISEITSQTLHFFRKRSVNENCSAADLIRGLLVLHRSRLKRADISIQLEEEPSHPVFCHAGELRQVFANLLTNAIDAFAGKAGTIWIRIHAGTVWKNSTPGVRITIADNGPGMDPDVRAKIYQAFFTTKPVSGTGLGLWVSAGIIDRHGGSIYVRSRKGRGTVFTIVLPTVQPTAISEAKSRPVPDRTKAA